MDLPVYTAMCMAASSKVTQSPASTLSLAASTWCVVVDSRWYILRLFKSSFYLVGFIRMLFTTSKEEQIEGIGYRLFMICTLIVIYTTIGARWYFW